jgi:hypothetical protein
MSMGAQTQGSQSEGSTGQTTSLSFVPSLLANAFFGTGIGVNQGGFNILGNADFNARGTPLAGGSSIVDPLGLSSIHPNVSGDSFAGGGNPYGLKNTSPFYSALTSGADSAGLGGILNDNVTGAGANADILGRSLATLGLGGTNAPSGIGTNTLLNPYDLLSNITDLMNPNINPAIGGALSGLGASEQGSGLANQLLGGNIAPAFAEGLNTGFKPDLQPIIDEAKRGFFQDIVPQLGQQNVALQEGVGPFSTDLSSQLLQAGTDMQTQLGALETGLQERAGDRRSDLLSLSDLITNQLFNSNTDAARNRLNLGEQLASVGTVGGRQATLLQLLAGQIPSGPIQASRQGSSSNAFGFDVGMPAGVFG